MLANTIARFIYQLYPLKRGRRFLNPLYNYISGYEIIKDSNKNLILLNLDNYIDSIIYFNESYEQKHIEFLYSKFIEYQCRYFIDIGANIGIYSMYFANSANLKTCYSFEPDPNNYAQLNANIFLNKQAQKVKLFNYALSDSSSRGELFIVSEKKDKDIDLGKHNSGMHSLEQNDCRHNHKIDIDIYRGDDLIDLRNEIICLKIDVEGHELNVLKGFKQLLTTNKCILMVEIFEEKFNEVSKFLLQNKFTIIKTETNFSDNYFYRNF